MPLGTHPFTSLLLVGAPLDSAENLTDVQLTGASQSDDLELAGLYGELMPPAKSPLLPG